MIPDSVEVDKNFLELLIGIAVVFIKEEAFSHSLNLMRLLNSLGVTEQSFKCAAMEMGGNLCFVQKSKNTGTWKSLPDWVSLDKEFIINLIGIVGLIMEDKDTDKENKNIPNLMKLLWSVGVEIHEFKDQVDCLKQHGCGHLFGEMDSRLYGGKNEPGHIWDS